MTDHHPITPPPELVQEWYDAARGPRCEQELATQAARWGADQELEACCEWLLCNLPGTYAGYAEHLRAEHLRAARRPKPPSLKEQAMKALNYVREGCESNDDLDTIRRALEALPE